jgi:MFS family permease
MTIPYNLGSNVPRLWLEGISFAHMYLSDRMRESSGHLSKEIWRMFSKLKSPDGFYGWVNLVVMFLFNIALYPMMFTFMLCLPVWREEFGWSMGDMTLAQSISLILSALTAPMVGIFIMKKGPRIAIVIGNLISAVALVLLSFQQHIWHLFINYGVILGLGISIGGMLAMMTVINNWFVMKRPMAMAVSMSSMGLGAVVLKPSLMMLINTIGWRDTYLITAAAVVLLCVILPALFLINKPEDLGQVPDGPSSEKHIIAEADGSPPPSVYKTPVDFTAKEALRTPTMWLLVGFAVVQFAVMQVIITHNFAFLQLDIGIPSVQAAFAAAILGPVMSVSQLGVGFLGLKFKMHSLAMVSILVAIVGFTIMIFTQSMGVALLYNTVLGMGFGIQAIAMNNLIPDYFGRTEFPKMMGFTMPFSMIIGAFLTPVAGYIREATESYILAFQISIAMLVLGLIFLIFARPPVHPSLKTSS